MTKQLSVFAPAKINLFLHVVGQRADGYHLLQSVFQLIDLSDLVHLTARTDGQITRTNPLPNVPAEEDLVVRAARLLQKTVGSSQGVDLRLDKNIPMGAGLGGGSSDAASTLLGLNQLWDLRLPLPQLMAIGLQLGADVPFFIQGNNAFVEGIGERITPIDLPDKTYFIIYPGVSIPTQSIFSAPNLTRNHSQITIIDFAELNSDLNMFSNDLQVIAEQKFVAVKHAIAWLSEEFEGSRPMMSGSGSSVFCEIPSNTHMTNCLSRLPQDWKGYKVKSLSQHSAYNIIPSSNLNNAELNTAALNTSAQQGSRQVG